MKLILIMNLILASFVAKADYITFDCDPSFNENVINEFYDEGSFQGTPNTISFADLSGDYSLTYKGQEIDRNDFSVSKDNSNFYEVTLNSIDGPFASGQILVFNAENSSNDYSALLTIFNDGGFSGYVQYGQALNCWYQAD